MPSSTRPSTSTACVITSYSIHYTKLYDSLPALALVTWRMLLVTATLACLPRVWRGLRALSPRLRWTYAAIGSYNFV